LIWDTKTPCFENIALLDANVLYPAPLRDYLLNLAAAGLYKPKWTDKIQDEWIRNLLLNRPDLKLQHLEKTRQAMDSAFPDAIVTHYQELISSISLPDPNDRHVLAAAIKTNAERIVTCNTKDFPGKSLKRYGIKALHPDEFIKNLINLDKTAVLEAFNNQVSRLRNPPKTKDEVLIALEKCGLTGTVSRLRV
jgi:predicted nucleic acid-binding protein